MPPPPRPGARSWLLGRAASDEKRSPYFSGEDRDLRTTAKRGEEDEGSQSRNERNKWQSVSPSKDTLHSSSHNENALSAHGPSSELPTVPVELVFRQPGKNLEAGRTINHRSDSETIPTDERRQRSLSEDEEEKRIHAEASREKRGFRSAKSLERSIVKRRKLRY